jgi:hypothetical protein
VHNIASIEADTGVKSFKSNVVVFVAKMHIPTSRKTHYWYMTITVSQFV